jgi:hypothetical protein
MFLKNVRSKKKDSKKTYEYIVLKNKKMDLKLILFLQKEKETRKLGLNNYVCCYIKKFNRNLHDVI